MRVLDGVELIGAGRTTVLKSMPTSVPDNGYGILQCGPESTTTANPRYAVRNLTLDGNVLERGRPGGEYQCYNLAIYSALGASIAATIDNVTSINSPIDCLLIYPNPANAHAIEVRGCYFSDGFRNTVTVCTGTDTVFSNCQFRNGGIPFGGTNPRSCLDIEPDDPDLPLPSRVRFDACVFYNGKNTVLGAQRCHAIFNACVFEAGPATVSPLYIEVTTGDVSFSACSFRNVLTHDSYLRQRSNYNPAIAGPYTTTSVIRITDCNFEGVGLEIQGHQAFISSSNFINSKYAVFFFPPIGKISGCVLQNVGWGASNGGAYAALTTLSEAVKKNITFENLLIRYNPSILPSSFTTPLRAYGIYLHQSFYTINLINVRCEGYYLIDSNINLFRDWSSPNLPPANSTAQTGPFVSGCTMGGPDFVFEENRS